MPALDRVEIQKYKGKPVQDTDDEGADSEDDD